MTTDGVHARRRWLSWWQQTALLVGVALLLAVAIKALLVQPFYIPTASMQPGLTVDDRILVQKVSYWFDGAPARGDVVVFEDPGGWLAPDGLPGPGNPLSRGLAAIGLYPEGGHLVKRVIAVAGDTVECCDRQGRILVNGHPLAESAYLPDRQLACHGPMPGTCDGPGWRAGPVPDGALFVMGDNRDRSEDSTVHLCTVRETDCSRDPYVDTDLVVGKVFARVWPPGHWGWVDTPDTFDHIPEPQ